MIFKISSDNFAIFSIFVVFTAAYSPETSDLRLKEYALHDRSLEICSKCCRAGRYEHGNEKCGLTIDSHAFAFDLLGHLAGENHDRENIVISPFSVMNILLLLSLGTDGETRDEIRRALNFPFYFPVEYDHMLMKCALMRYDGVSIRASNAVFYDREMTTSRHSFLQQASRYYNVTVKGVSFSTDPFHAWLSISDFIRETTGGFLDNVLQETAIAELLFINTVYFNGTWNFEVPPSSAKKMMFYKDYRTARKVESFTVMDVFSTATIDGLEYYGDKIRVVELPYSDTQFSMYIFKSENGKLSLKFIEEFIKKRTVAGIKYYYMAKEMVNLTIPKFSITYQGDISEALTKMGVQGLFSKSPDLSNLFTDDNLSADKLVHTAKIMVTEAGTEAAAASIVYISRGGDNVEKITFSHPFIFVIYDNCNNLILFQGRCYDPRI